MWLLKKRVSTFKTRFTMVNIRFTTVTTDIVFSFIFYSNSATDFSEIILVFCKLGIHYYELVR
jgi:hypothetical protein